MKFQKNNFNMIIKGEKAMYGNAFGYLLENKYKIGVKQKKGVSCWYCFLK
jgi:hypothetical protein